MKSNIYFNTAITQKENQTVTTYPMSSNYCKICKNTKTFNDNNYTNKLKLFSNNSMNEDDLKRIFELKTSHNAENHVLQDLNNQILIDFSLSSDKNSVFIKPCECNFIVHSTCLLQKCIFTNTISCKYCRCLYSIQIETRDYVLKLNHTRITIFKLIFVFILIYITLTIFSYANIFTIKSEFGHWKYLLGIFFLLLSILSLMYLFSFYLSSKRPSISSIQILDYNVDNQIEINSFCTLLNQVTKKTLEELVYFKYDDIFYKHYLSLENNRIRNLVKKKEKEQISFRSINQLLISDYVITNSFLISQALKDKEQFLKKQYSIQLKNSINSKLKEHVEFLKKSRTKHVINEKGSVISLNAKMIRILKENDLQDNKIKEEAEEEEIIKRKNSRINSKELLLNNKVIAIRSDNDYNSFEKKISTKGIEQINISSQPNNTETNFNQSELQLIQIKKVPELPRKNKRPFTQKNIPLCK
jgi:hypothetical protein